MNLKVRNTLIFALLMLIFCGCFSPYAFSGDSKILKVADMEKDFKFRALPVRETAKVTFSSETASQGNRSLRFEYTSYGKNRIGLYIPFTKDASEYDTLAFDFYCESNNGAVMMPHVTENHLTKKGSDGASSYGYVNLKEGRDGWVTLRFKRGRSFKIRGASKADWSNLRHISFGFVKEMHGKMVIYLDNIRFEKSDDGVDSDNLVFNSSFEQTTNPGIPDGWHRDLRIPPHGKDIWGIDDKVAFHGKKSMRIGYKGKSLILMEGHVRANKGKDYTFSIYLKSDKDGTEAILENIGLKIAGRKKIVKVGKKWKKFSVTGKAIGAFSSPRVTLGTENAVLWCDAAQFSEGKTTPPYKGPSLAASGDKSEASVWPKKSKNVPVLEIKKAKTEPVIDGNLDDKCWKNAGSMKSFFKFDEKVLSPDETEAKVIFDDQAIYISVFAKDKDMARVKKTLAASKRGPWDSDLIEVFVDLNNDAKSYYHFAANSNGDKYSKAFIGPRQPIKWNYDWSVAGKVLKDGWTVEMKIPYVGFDLSKINKSGEIGINICRTSLGSDKRYSTWAFTGEGFHVPWMFGTLKGFDAQVIKTFLFDVVSINWARGKATATLKNNTKKDSNLNLKFEVVAPDGAKTYTKAFAKAIKSGAAMDVEAPLAIKEDGLYKLRIIGVDKNGVQRLVSQYKQVRISGASLFDFTGTEFDFYTSDKEAKARCIIEADKEGCKKLKLCWSLEKNGKTIGKVHKISLKPGINEWSFPLGKLANGSYKLVGELYQNSKKLNRQECVFKKLPPAKQEVRVNRWGQFFVHNGKPLFAYGFYDNSVDYDDMKSWKGLLADTRKANCTVHMVYMGNSPVTHKNIGKYLDAAEASGQKVLLCLSGMFAWHIKKYKGQGKGQRYFSEEEAGKALRELVSKNKDHPALLGWCTIDEPGNRPNIFTGAILKKYYDQVKAIDPHHPCAPSHMTHIGDSKIYGDASDFAMIVYKATGSRYDYLIQEFKALRMPIMTNTPCYGGIGKLVREPTAAEQRMSLYKAIILGARGICQYTYRPSGQDLWDEIKQIGKELKYLSPVLLTADDKLRLDISSIGDSVCGVLKKHNDKYYLIAVNTSSRAVDVSFRLSSVPEISSVQPLFNTKTPEVDKKLKTLKLKMDKQSTVLYEIR